jgi:hypothetical protein
MPGGDLVDDDGAGVPARRDLVDEVEDAPTVGGLYWQWT